MTTKTKSPTPVRTELIKHSGCRVDIEGRISYVNSNKACTCIIDVRINGEKLETDHLRFQLKHNLGRGDKIKFKGLIGCYDNFRNYGVIEAKSLKDWYS